MQNEIEIAKSDLISAKKMLDIGVWNWAHNAAYNAMLQAGRALMFAKGYRPKGGEHHISVISFIQAIYSAKLPSESLQAFDKARKRRKESLYDRPETISESQARNLVEKADLFVKKAQEIL
jgi:uncharacterized protein (UPF0332 family)